MDVAEVDAVEVRHVQGQVLDTFIESARRVAAAELNRHRAVETLRPAFRRLLADRGWLPAEFTQPDPSGGMAAGVGNYLIYRTPERDLTLMSLVLAPGTATPIHDHLAWGLVGLYAGEQDEVVYAHTGSDAAAGRAELREIERRHLIPGDIYDLLPPRGDIHQVQTAGDEPSVSIHLLGNDIGCVWRHRYEAENGRVLPFRSGYSNQRCPDRTVSR